MNTGTKKKGTKRLIGLILANFIGDSQVERRDEAKKNEVEQGKEKPMEKNEKKRTETQLKDIIRLIGPSPANFCGGGGATRHKREGLQ